MADSVITKNYNEFEFTIISYVLNRNKKFDAKIYCSNIILIMVDYMVVSIDKSGSIHRTSSVCVVATRVSREFHVFHELEIIN